MKYKKIILAGGNGYIGKVLLNHYRAIAQEIIILSRTYRPEDGNVKTLIWDGNTPGEWVKAIEGAELLINLCGKNVNCRYTEKNKEEIFASRIIPTALLGRVIEKMEHPPMLWINITSATMYRHAEDRPQDEYNGEIGKGFSIEVCRKWEDTFFKASTPHTRKIALRMGIVLGLADGALPRLLNLVRLGLGGRQGNGQQYVSWVHEHDAANCTEWLLQHTELEGVLNCTAPQPIKNVAFMTCIREACNVRFGLPTPAWLLKIGAIVIGTETELILKSRWVVPKRLTDSGFTFLFPTTEQAIKNILIN